MNRKKYVPLENLALVLLGLVFGNAHANQRPGQATGRGADSGSRQGGHDRTRSDKWANAWNGQGANPDQPPKPAPYDPAGSCASRSTFRRLRVLFMSNVARSRFVGEQEGDVVARESGQSQLVRNPLGLRLACRDTKHCLVSH